MGSKNKKKRDIKFWIQGLEQTMPMELFMVWRRKQFLAIKNDTLDTSLLLVASDRVKELFNFLSTFNYVLTQSKMLDGNTVELIYNNDVVSKEINIRIYNYDDVGRFFLNIFIIKMPYLTVTDLIDISTYFDKNHIKYPKTLEGNQRNIENANKYIKAYAELCKTHGINLITSDKQFSHYFPEWT